MSDDTLIADLVRAGVSAELVGRVARLIIVTQCHVTSRDAIEKRRADDKERQQRRRDKLKKNKEESAKANDVAHHVKSRDCHVTGVIASSILSKKDTTVVGSEESKKERTELSSARARATRIPPDWRPSEADLAFAVQHGLNGHKLAEEFIDYWIAVPGQRGTKLNWSATYRNRVRQKGAAPVSAPSTSEPIWTKPPTEFLERQRNATKTTSVRSDAVVSNNGASHAPELCLSGGGLLCPKVGGAEGDAPDDHHAKR